jgi:phosphoglycolate phosphatase-like HAD superfamily hydrolase
VQPVSATSPLRKWDEYDAYLFDIDGTLLTCHDAVHYFAFCEALTTLAGRELNLDGVVAHGNTDVGILRDVLKLHGVADDTWRPHLSQATEGMCRFVHTRAQDLRVEPIPGMVGVLSHLQSKGAVLGVATGNLQAIGWLKLERSGLRGFFRFGGFSDGYEYRADVFRAAVKEVRHRTHPGASICVVGDTPSDIQAARDNHLDVIAVATGIFDIDALAAEAPTRCVASLQQLLEGSVSG